MKIGAFSGEGCKSSYSDGRSKFLTYTHNDDAWETVGVDYAAKNLVEGCIFINPKGLYENGGTVNGQEVHLCSNINNPGFNFGQRVTVELRNINVSGVGCGENIVDINESNIRVYCYDTFYSCMDFCLFGNDNGVEFSDLIQSAHVVITHCDGAPDSISIECTKVEHKIDLTDVSIPIKDFKVDKRSKESAKYTVHKDVNIVQFSNYGLRLDGKGNPVQSAYLTLNGHKRFNEQEGSYFNYYQPFEYHTRTPKDGICVYSFSLHPEVHQPSGTTNFSRIDSTILWLNIGDCLRKNRRLKLDIARDTKLYIFAWTLNVLRVMGGLGGMAYSN